MNTRTSRRGSQALLAAAAVFAIISLVLVVWVTAERQQSAQAAAEARSELQADYDSARTDVITSADGHVAARCEAEARIVEAARLEGRGVAALDASSAAYDAYLTFPLAERNAFETARSATIIALQGAALAPDDQALASTYDDITDVGAECETRHAVTLPVTPPAPTQADLDELATIEASLAEEPLPDTSRIDAFDAALLGIGPAAQALGTSAVAVTGTDETAAALVDALDAYAAASDPASTVQLLEALQAHASSTIQIQLNLAQTSTTPPVSGSGSPTQTAAPTASPSPSPVESDPAPSEIAPEPTIDPTEEPVP